jgi:hypothetical protein
MNVGCKRAGCRQLITVAELAELFLFEHVEPKRKGSAALDYRWILSESIVPGLGMFKAHEVARNDVVKLHLRRRTTPYQANRGHLADDTYPAWHIERYPEPRRERFLTVGDVERSAQATVRFRQPSIGCVVPERRQTDTRYRAR